MSEIESVSETITLDDKEYSIEDMTEAELHYLNQIKSCTAQSRELQNKLQQCEVARVAFVDMLREELNKMPEEE
jgi:hypothetical protein|tara:strand:+ start:2452 stop:2673 length:222 start_codon:yes stop_codon:yes gene_type:complete